MLKFWNYNHKIHFLHTGTRQLLKSTFKNSKKGVKLYIFLLVYNYESEICIDNDNAPEMTRI